MNRQMRACDRCAELKAQCAAGESPCSRCRRLGLRCTRDRPALVRGRPRKYAAKKQSSRQPPSHPPASPKPPQWPDSAPDCDADVDADVVIQPDPDPNPAPAPSSSPPDGGTLLADDDVEDLPIGLALAESLLRNVLDSAHCIGILSAFRRGHYRIEGCSETGMAVPSAVRDYEFGFLKSRAILFTLFACSESFTPKTSERTSPGEQRLEDYRIYALSDIPILTWKSRPVSNSHIYCLYLLSNLGYLHHELTNMAGRWAMLSETLASSCLRPASAISPGSQSAHDGLMEIDQRILALVSLNSDVHGLLFNQRFKNDGASVQTPDVIGRYVADKEEYLGPAVPDCAWHEPFGCLLGGPDPAFKPEEGFFDLFIPLQACLKQALSLPTHEALAHSLVARSLEDYFVTFPSSIMKLAQVKLSWQLEAMIWFHGIYLLINSGPDLVTVLTSITETMSTAHAADHALLLAEILPHLLRMESAVLHISHLTIYFIALSAALHVFLLQRIYTGPYAVPPLLLDSAKVHARMLDTILEENRTCDHPCIQSVARMLALVVATRSVDAHVESSQLASPLEQLRLYRWIPGGRGLLPVDDLAAGALTATPSSVGQGVGEVIPPGPSLDLQKVFDPTIRINEPGTFDLSILF
ncbi:hypothetical protein S40288_09273 [Stachybotrys chartarum IBT 40288]|nr:hypothetical protein S40288_09273 [Stachybotrys chartarum IBT 40288]